MVKLMDVVDSMGTDFDTTHTYYDRENDEIVVVMEDVRFDDDVDLDDPNLSEPSWMVDMGRLARRIDEDDGSVFVPLPTQWEIHEHAIMCDFVDTLPEGNMQERLWNNLHGSGAFRRFKDGVHQYDIADAWYRFRDRRFIAIARDWCQENDIPLTVTSDGPHAAELAELAKEFAAEEARVEVRDSAPVAHFDPDRGQAYLLHADGHREYIEG